MSTERLNQSTDRIKESRRTMLETEELGVSILQDLHQQRQSLLHAHDTVCLLPIKFPLRVRLHNRKFQENMRKKSIEKGWKKEQEKENEN